MDSLAVAMSLREVYRAAISTPSCSHAVNLDFEARDAEGQFVTPEGVLKYKILSSVSTEAVTAAAGQLNPAHGVVGMAGVGKTIALQGLACDGDIRERFPDGIQYLSLGQGATVQIAVGEIAKVMTMSGASASAARVETSTSLEEAIDHAKRWFQDKKCLFLIDDLWPTEDCSTGYLPAFRQLLRESPESRMAVSTRSVSIAVGAGSIVDFGARDPLGPVSAAIFMAHAIGCSRNYGVDISSKLARILARCGGLPIALSVSGCAVALLVRRFGNFERACDIYVTGFGGRKIRSCHRARPRREELVRRYSSQPQILAN